MQIPVQHRPLYVRGRTRRYKVANADDIVEAARAVVDQRMQRGDPFSKPADTRAFFQAKLGGLVREVFAAAYLDTHHRLIEYQELFPWHDRWCRGPPQGSRTTWAAMQRCCRTGGT